MVSAGVPLLSEIGPFTKCFYLEKTCPNDNISFWLYNQDHRDTPYRLQPEVESSLEDAPVSGAANELVILIHGYTGSRDYSPNTELRPAYLNYGDYNIITVDWGLGAKDPCYLHAAFNIGVAAKCSAKLLRRMLELHPDKLSIKYTHVIGFSLGAHVAGIMGKTYKKLYNECIPRITGLDPALPLFDILTRRSNFYLDKGDADFVDVIHTNAGRKGRLYQVGNADFYVNNAGIQPGCLSNWSCDHVRAVELYAESISSKEGFWGTRCEVRAAQFLIGFASEACALLKSHSKDPPVLMGEHIDTSVRGTYLIRTRAHSPYAYGKHDYQAAYVI
ncbi:Lipase [Nesidiocoris tenuis]|uniref:Lipase n=1 Tax=Nesidiocoris tenuis TaxID=355587 RepID=A0ABN7ATU2_9HEMI|nr:Lipase [Nesidiocoris tenuis]